MIAKAGFAVFLSGNKLAGAKIVSAEGVREEFEIAVARRAYPIPVGATGHVAAALLDRGDVESTKVLRRACGGRGEAAREAERREGI